MGSLDKSTSDVKIIEEIIVEGNKVLTTVDINEVKYYFKSTEELVKESVKNVLFEFPGLFGNASFFDYLRKDLQENNFSENLVSLHVPYENFSSNEGLNNYILNFINHFKLNITSIVSNSIGDAVAMNILSQEKNKNTFKDLKNYFAIGGASYGEIDLSPKKSSAITALRGIALINKPNIKKFFKLMNDNLAIISKEMAHVSEKGLTNDQKQIIYSFYIHTLFDMNGAIQEDESIRKDWQNNTKNTNSIIKKLEKDFSYLEKISALYSDIKFFNMNGEFDAVTTKESAMKKTDLQNKYRLKAEFVEIPRAAHSPIGNKKFISNFIQSRLAN